MGLTLTTLAIYGDAAPLLPLLKGGQSVRTHCPGWTVVLPGETEDHGYSSLQKLARKYPGACLYFHNFDDDFFVLHLYADGKRKAVLSSDTDVERSSKPELISPALFGDDRATAALKLIAKSGDLEEQLTILEQTLGVSLMEDPEFEPRTVAYSTAAFDALAARLAALKKRKNTYKAVLLDEADVPQELHSVSPMSAYGPPKLHTTALPAFDSAGRPLAGEVQVDSRQDALAHPSGDYMGCAFLEHRPSVAVRMNREGEILWAFAPQGLESLLVCPAKDADTLLVLEPLARRDARLWLLSAADGRILREALLPEGCAGMPRWIGCIGQYAAFWRTQDSRGFLLLDEQLRIVARREIPDMAVPFANPTTVAGSVFWGQNVFTHQVVSYDVADGTLTEIPLEDKAYFTGLGADGLLTAIKTGKELLLFDRAGKLVSKHPFKGVATLQNIPVIGGKMYIVEEMGSMAQVFQDVRPEKRVWRLDKA